MFPQHLHRLGSKQTGLRSAENGEHVLPKQLRNSCNYSENSICCAPASTQKLQSDWEQQIKLSLHDHAHVNKSIDYSDNSYTQSKFWMQWEKTGNWSNQCAIFLNDLQVQFSPRRLFSFHNSKTNSTDKAYPRITHTHARTMAMKSDSIKGRLKSCWKEVGKNRGTVLHAGQRGSEKRKKRKA